MLRFKARGVKYLIFVHYLPKELLGLHPATFLDKPSALEQNKILVIEAPFSHLLPGACSGIVVLPSTIGLIEGPIDSLCKLFI